MITAVERLCALVDAEDPYDYAQSDVAALQLEAVNERFEQARETIRVLERRASDEGVKGIESLGDVVPLLFSHTTYKSYPESFVTEGRWGALAAWLDTLSTKRGARDVDLSGVSDIDGWLERMNDADQYVFVSSGTTGKSSLLNSTPTDRATNRQATVMNVQWATGAVPEQSRPVMILSPSRGWYRGVRGWANLAEAYGRPDAIYWLTDEPIRVSDINAMGTLRKKMAEGSAMPSEIAAAEEQGAKRAARAAADMERMVDLIVEHQHEPCLIGALWPQHWSVLQAAKDRLTDGLHPETVVFTGGGTKGLDLPPDFEEQVRRGYGLEWSQFLHGYGMVDCHTNYPGCVANKHRYHVPPWIVPLILDKPGEQLLALEDGRVEGRFAFFDVMLEGRWSGTISGDRVLLDMNSCPDCGRRGPTVTNIARYSDLPEGDDKLTCAGTIDAYVRGEIRA